ncbi:MAG: sigma-54 dependent transcriptional regulator [Gemmatimonadota bacterium]|nr:sigma-54 dependent transcriptional regulator [Gemmatimonadota bacterium]
MSDTRIRVLVAEDEPHLGAILEKFLSQRNYDVTTRTDGRAALDALRSESFDVALLDIVMPEMDGLEVLRQLQEESAPPEVIIITGNGTVETAISAMKLGAYDYLSKPYRMAEIDVLVRRAWEKRQLARENTLLQSRLGRLDATPPVETRYAPMQAVLALVERVARSDSAVLIHGESGTGKEVVARTIHRLSHRASGPLVDLDCASLPESTIESELFGYEKGAFPGASARTLGLFELASKGTIFLDEIAALEQRLQGKLLRVLEQGTFYRIGGTQKVFTDLRVVASTSRDLAESVARGTFRSDLYYRINTISIRLPPLRERSVDIPLLAASFLRTFGGPTPPVLGDEALAVLQAYRWPGNIRELRNVIERAVLLSTGGVIRPSDLPIASADARPVSRGRVEDPLMSLESVERSHIERVLEHVGWHQGRAADALGISPKTLYRKIREYGFRRPPEPTRLGGLRPGGEAGRG